MALHCAEAIWHVIPPGQQMTKPPALPRPNRYERDLSTEVDSSLSLLARWIPRGAKVLELGPATGYFTKVLNKDLDCCVDAVERDAAMAELARPFCRDLFVADLEEVTLGKMFAGRRYDAVVIADVIEHLSEPDRLLDQLPPLLSAKGEVLFSVPNISYVGVVAELLNGNFEYRDLGILDRTHLRFFTRTSLAALLRSHSLHPWEWRSVLRPLGESEFKVRVDGFGSDLYARLTAHPDALCYQWLVRTRVEPPPSQPEPPPPCGPDRFPMRAFWAAEGDAFDYQRSAIGWGSIGTGLNLISMQVRVEQRLRLRLADRTGFLHIFAITIRSQSGDALWKWSHREGGGVAIASAYGVLLQSCPGHLLATILGPDSWCELRLPPLSRETVSLEVECSWPLSADFLAAKQTWEAETQRIEAMLEQIRVADRFSASDAAASRLVSAAGLHAGDLGGHSKSGPIDEDSVAMLPVASLGETRELRVALGRLGHRITDTAHWGSVDLPSLVRAFEEGLKTIWCNPDATMLRTAFGGICRNVESPNSIHVELERLPSGIVVETGIIDRNFNDQLSAEPSFLQGQAYLVEDVLQIGATAVADANRRFAVASLERFRSGLQSGRITTLLRSESLFSQLGADLPALLHRLSSAMRTLGVRGKVQLHFALRKRDAHLASRITPRLSGIEAIDVYLHPLFDDFADQSSAADIEPRWPQWLAFFKAARLLHSQIDGTAMPDNAPSMACIRLAITQVAPPAPWVWALATLRARALDESADATPGAHLQECLSLFEAALADRSLPGTVQGLISLAGLCVLAERTGLPRPVREHAWDLALDCLARICGRATERARRELPVIAQVALTQCGFRAHAGKQGLRLVAQLAFHAFGDARVHYPGGFWLWAARVFAWTDLPLVARQALGHIDASSLNPSDRQHLQIVESDLKHVMTGEKCSGAAQCQAQKSIEGVAPSQISGWVWCPLRPLESLEVEVFRVDGRHVATGRADQFRHELLRSGKGHGRHWFSLKPREHTYLGTAPPVIRIKGCRA